MAIEKRIYSDLPIPPGEYLAEVIAARGISQADLARRLGRPVQAVNEIGHAGMAHVFLSMDVKKPPRWVACGGA